MHGLHDVAIRWLQSYLSITKRNLNKEEILCKSKKRSNNTGVCIQVRQRNYK